MTQIAISSTAAFHCATCTIRRTCMLSYRMQFSRAEISLLKRRIAGIPDSCLSAGSAALCEVNCRTTPADDDDEMATRRRLLDEQSYSMPQSAVQLCSSVCALRRPMNSQQNIEQSASHAVPATSTTICSITEL